MIKPKLISFSKVSLVDYSNLEPVENMLYIVEEPGHNRFKLAFNGKELDSGPSETYRLSHSSPDPDLYKTWYEIIGPNP